MKVNKEALSELLSPKASCRLADCLPASYNLEMLADVGGLVEERVEKHSDLKWGENGDWHAQRRCSEMRQAEICVCVRKCVSGLMYMSVCELVNVCVCVCVRVKV